MSKSIDFVLNGQEASATCRPDTTVLEWLRGDALLRGTKEGCAEGDCGACSVLVKRPSLDGSTTQYQATNSCILLMGQLEGAALITVEGLAQSRPNGHAVQQRMAENGSSQCGFCTPGIVVSLAGLLESNSKPNETEVHDALAGNLCRCTGYRPIVEASLAAAQDNSDGLSEVVSVANKHDVGMPNECQLHLPKNIKELHALRKQHQGAVVLAGGTDIALDVAHARARWPQTISTRDVAELHVLEVDEKHLLVGGAVTWQTLLPYLKKYWPSFATLVRRFGSTQIRSQGTIAGNLATASPIGDGAPSLLALNASLTLSSENGDRVLPLHQFFLDYRMCDLKEDEIIKSIHIPLPDPIFDFRVYKVSKRYDQDISTVCGAFSIYINDGIVSDARIAFGGMAATPKRCEDAERALIGNNLDEATLDAVRTTISATYKPMSDVRGSDGYRAQVACNLAERFFRDLQGETVEVMEL